MRSPSLTFLEQLLTIELDARQPRTGETLLKFTGLPAAKRFNDYDFTFATGTPRKQLQTLTNLAFIELTENIVLLDSSSVGKSSLAVSLTHSAILKGIKTRFINTADLMLQLSTDKRSIGYVP